MITYSNLYPVLCSYENLLLAYKKARSGKTQREYVKSFEANLDNNLLELKKQLETQSYTPSALTTFIVRDPKTRKINASAFKDRVVHHALCNVIVPIFEKRFIHDSFANQKQKGTHKAIERFEEFLRKTLKERVGQKKLFGQDLTGYALKADIRHYFDTVDHAKLLEIIEKRIKDPKVLWLIKKIIENHSVEVKGKGMPIGNLTSQFFANVYLDQLDQFVKHTLKVRYYIRYVDDFILLHESPKVLESWRAQINEYLLSELKLELHPEKSKIHALAKGTTFLGFRVFPKHRLLKKSNSRRIWRRVDAIGNMYLSGKLQKQEAIDKLEGWMAYAKFANTYNLRQRVSQKFVNRLVEAELRLSPQLALNSQLLPSTPTIPLFGGRSK